MEFDFLSPVNDELLDEIKSLNPQTIGANIRLHTDRSGIPELEGVNVAIFGVRENRRAERPENKPDFSNLRKQFYGLFPGNWKLKLADLGDIEPGATVEDTYFAVQNLVESLIKQDIIPIILGGGQDLIYAQYRAYDNLDQMVNLVNIDKRFDLGDAEKMISNQSYVGKIVVDQPYNLFNYSAVGYQTYFNSQDEIELMERLFFEAYRLGEVTSDIALMEPIFRSANIVGMDLGAIDSAAMNSAYFNSPNGFNGREICALSRYAGISDKVSSFGVYEYQGNLGDLANMLVAQIIWYFIEGVNYRTNENTISAKKEFTKYQVPIDDEILVFFKSPVSGRWWIEIPFLSNVNTKLKRHTLLPCSEEDYLEACNQVIPERWYKAKRKNEV
ncbi:arginase family enzyme [Christiangramia gaetbulicola]|uniref:Arginase family enzyme n=1 Tax=Christiangramia gaetbulicola TaxID=703340 RepID=A0A2T6ACV9_9FLAO|nr:formimidoylglutamase [Christiangramia gaetbulicola]PTX41616.1 arginase family enzyme [Christiangramia gaetbulicola]